jgi:hypothetical protein
VTTTTERIVSTGGFANRERATTDTPDRGIGPALLGNAAYVLRQLAGCLAIIVLVWLAVMLYRHLQPVALVLTGVLLVLGGVALFVRNRSLARADWGFAKIETVLVQAAPRPERSFGAPVSPRSAGSALV